MADTETALAAEDNTDTVAEAANDQATEPVEVSAEDHAQEQAESMFDGKSSADSEDAATDADTEEQARKILLDKGGLDIEGDLCLDEDNYKRAELVGVLQPQASEQKG